MKTSTTQSSTQLSIKGVKISSQPGHHASQCAHRQSISQPLITRHMYIYTCMCVVAAELCRVVYLRKSTSHMHSIDG